MQKAATRKGRFGFISETIAELKKVVWPTRQEALKLTIMVLIVCIVLGALLGIVDFGFTKLVREAFLRGT